VAIGAYLIKTLGTKSLQGKAILFITIGFVSWTIAEILWIIYQNAIVSPADVFYLLSYPLLVIGILYGIKMSNPYIFKDKKRMLILSFIAIAVLGSYLYFFPLSWDHEITFVENIVTGGYVIADMLLLIPLVFLCYSLISGTLSIGWIIFAAGVVAMLIADLWYALNYELYTSGKQYIDLAWYLSYFFFIYALIQFKRIQKHVKEIVTKKS
ncbi:hypothetical protein A3K72_02440, partial [Candidatus Woesearchaeota archaeon RBG_13_36_6]